MLGPNKNKVAWTLASEKLLSIYRNESRYSYQDPHRNVSLSQEPVEVKPSSHTYQDRLRTLWYYIDKIYFKQLGQSQMMILKELKDDQIVWNPNIYIQEQEQEDLQQFEKDRRQVFSQSYLKQRQCLQQLDEHRYKKEKQLSYAKWRLMKHINRYTQQEIMKIKNVWNQRYMKVFETTSNDELIQQRTYDQYLQNQIQQMERIINHKDHKKRTVQYNQQELLSIFIEYEDIKQSNCRIIEIIQSSIQQEFLQKLQQIYKHFKVDQKYLLKIIPNVHIDYMHLYDTFQNSAIVKYLKAEIIILQKRQIAQSIRNCQPEVRAQDIDNKQTKRYYVSYQNAMNLRPILISQEQLYQINRHRDNGPIDKREVSYKIEMCHHCKNIVKLQNLFKCGYQSSKLGIPIPYPSFHDPYIFNILKYEGRKYQSVYQINSNVKVESKYIYYTFQNGQYFCNRYYCELCIKAYRPMMKTSGLCPFCERICCCTRCTRDVYISKLKTICLYLGQDIYQIQAQSYFLNFYLKNENFCGRQLKKLQLLDRQYLLGNRMQIQSLRLLSNMICRRQKLKTDQFLTINQMFYAKLDYITNMKGYDIDSQKRE